MPQLRTCWTEGLMSTPLALRAIFTRSASAEIVPWAQQLPQSAHAHNAPPEMVEEHTSWVRAAIVGWRTVTHSHWGMCWLRLLVRKDVPPTSRHEKDVGRSETLT
eukprot:COSAG01_NODE_6600_length_3585_cov_155.033276_2_plen_105_part_00